MAHWGLLCQRKKKHLLHTHLVLQANCHRMHGACKIKTTLSVELYECETWRLTLSVEH
jgi:hypothetical protein